MSQAGKIGEPRGLVTAPQGIDLGGANGPIAIPSKLAAYEGAGQLAHPSLVPPRGGQHGFMALRRFLSPQVWQEPRTPMPVAYARTFYSRRLLPNIYGLLHTILPRGAFSWTANRAPEQGAPLDPIPVSSQWWSRSWYMPYDTRVATVYHPPELIQGSQVTRKVLVGPDNAMTPPWFNRITRWIPAPSFGVSQTDPVPGGGA